MVTREIITVEDASIEFETDGLARQADGAVVVRHGTSMILATVVAEDGHRQDGDFVPLTVDYHERMSAGGRIPGSYHRREARSSEREVLTSRLIDRAIRPLFPVDYRRRTQVVVTVFGADPGSDLECLALLAAAGALHVSGLPFAGPLAAARVTRRGDRDQLFASERQRQESDSDWIVAAAPTGIVMIEGGGAPLEDERVLDLVDRATGPITSLHDALDRLRARARRRPAPSPRRPAAARAEDTVAGLLSAHEGRFVSAYAAPDKRAARHAWRALRAEVALGLTAGGTPEADAARLFEAARRRFIRGELTRGRRAGGRQLDEIRPVTAAVGVLPSAHGSALFTRGDTQALVTTTLGGADEVQEVESVLGRRSEHFLLHYNFPPYAVGEATPLRGPGRRELGHGALARRALAPVLPRRDDLPWTLRVVSDVLESDGSSSMATVCGASLALMDAGIAITAPVAGIAMGLVRAGERPIILSDISGLEDQLGDMDLKLAGTSGGFTAVQLDTKGGGLDRAALGAALAQGRRGLDRLLGHMALALARPRESIAPHAPQVAQFTVPRRSIARLIGPGGRRISEMQNQTRTRIDVRDDGRVRIFARSPEDLARGVERVREEAVELVVGGVYWAEVVALKEYGAFVRIGAHEALVHISELEKGRTERVDEAVRVGDRVRVMVKGADSRGRLELSRRAALDTPEDEILSF